MSDDTSARFQALGRSLEEAWRRDSCDERAFPALAAAHLRDAALPSSVTVDALLDWALSASSPPPQQDAQARFGQPPLTMFVGRHFHISVLFWVDGTTTIHQHGFCGAFQVLAGSSIHTRYTFETQRRVSARLRFGTLTAQRSELLCAGAIHPIASGDGLIHALFHLERPSASIVVRTFSDPDAQPQLDYRQPGLAFDPFADDAWQQRLEQLVSLMVTLEDPACERRVASLLRTEDLFTCFRVLRRAQALTDKRIFARLLDVVAERDREAATIFSAAFSESRRIDGIVKRRATVVDPELRFFLAVLLNAPDRASVLDLFATHHPADEPVEAVLRALGGIGKAAIPVQVRGEAWDPNVFGLPPAPAGWEDALRAELLGREPGVTTPEVAAYVERMRRTPALSSLFRVRAFT